MENREQLKDITRLSESVVRVLGQNPGQFTLQGTNTYIIGSQNPYILIDTAEGLDSYIPILKSALESPSNPDQVDVSDIIISHWHHDHVGGIPSVLKLLKDLWEGRNAGKPYTPPRLHKYPLHDGVDGGHTNSEWNKLPRLAEQLSKATYTPSLTGHIFHDLFDSQVIQDHNGSPVLRVLYTPGHTVDSIALYVYPDSTLYTADTVLGHGTAVFEDLAAYLTSLKRMLQFGTPSASGRRRLLNSKGRELLSTYIEHRLEREAQVIGVLRTPTTANLSENEANSEKGFSLWTTWDIVETLYKGYPESLWLPAARGVDLHLKKLESEGFAQHVGGEGKDAKWKLLVSPSATPSL
ncbi:beta-lactamase-like protein [Gymnopilus junonius]|uniref:Beta-lactamase-like protein n=1 Tax=Gymnopilus junonius TaxID=109634 RepID=A0A9P5NM49_GYMJU|nr:beta-lactamase-like protein [Gymnopilus junonius]